MMIAPSHTPLRRVVLPKIAFSTGPVRCVQIMDEPPLNGAPAPVALPLDEVGAIRGGVSTVSSASTRLGRLRAG